jgi:glycosyltransferase, family 8
MDILVTLDDGYMPQLRVMLTSLYISNPDLKCRIYLLHSGIPEDHLSELGLSLQKIGYQLFPINIDEGLFENAPVTKQYPKEMYYRLLAAQILPAELDKVLYLDPDILVINSLRPLWELDLKDRLFAAASHTGKTELANNINKFRLGTDQKYYNSGVLLMNLSLCRSEIVPEEIFSFVREHTLNLLLPDQDILNAIYGGRIQEIDDFLWNYDARNYNNYFLRSAGEADLEWVIKNTSILHFCGKAKPWKPHYTHRFGILYRHYMQLADSYL